MIRPSTAPASHGGGSRIDAGWAGFVLSGQSRNSASDAPGWQFRAGALAMMLMVGGGALVLLAPALSRPVLLAVLACGIPLLIAIARLHAPMAARAGLGLLLAVPMLAAVALGDPFGLRATQQSYDAAASGRGDRPAPAPAPAMRAPELAAPRADVAASGSRFRIHFAPVDGGLFWSVADGVARRRCGRITLAGPPPALDDPRFATLFARALAASRAAGAPRCR